MVQVVWFKRDLRTVDHQPLADAALAGPVLPLYVADPDYWRQPSASARQWRAIAPALAELSSALERLGGPLVVRVGSVTEILARIHGSIGITRLLAHEETGDGWTFERDKHVRRLCRSLGIPFVEYPQFGVIRGLKDRNQWGRRHAAFMSAPLVREPARFTPVPARAGVIPAAADLGLSEDGCAEPQQGTREDGLARLRGFLGGGGANYRRGMSSPLTGESACSRLSVSLAAGAISMREVMRRLHVARADLAKAAPEARPLPLTAIDSLLSRLYWHCHFIQKLEQEPELETRSLHPLHEKARQRTALDDPTLEAWVTGRTGFPFVDACMRSLIATGWLNFRMRAMVMAFASYHLALDWWASGTRLAALFTDYEPGIHWPQVQMQSGQTGINTPRIYNPVKQGLDQDPDGVFTRRWLPELREVPLAFLQEPWRMGPAAQEAARCRLGIDYPLPIVAHEVAARLARDRITIVRRETGYREHAQRVFDRHGSRRRRIDEDDPPKSRAIAAARATRAAKQLALDL
ncbi:MAG: deoxyribodipyrimidine photo-lyase/cryptochrome family protein [Beijerinckiaceae bacterium]|nr:deoxyribodipyrimidine photo-lyase/cryptochrome family protein [Beijerinckiaceae bacterium]